MPFNMEEFVKDLQPHVLLAEKTAREVREAQRAITQTKVEKRVSGILSKFKQLSAYQVDIQAPIDKEEREMLEVTLRKMRFEIIINPDSFGHWRVRIPLNQRPPLNPLVPYMP